MTTRGAKGAPAARGAKGAVTREQLVEATLACIREGGFARLSARAIATRAGLNQALVFYHFESLTGLVVSAYDVALQQAMATYRAELLPVTSLDALVDRAEALVLDERDAGAGRGVLMVQLMAQAQHDATLADVARDALVTWRALAREVLDAALDASSAAVLIDRAALADALVSALLGVVLVASVEERGGGAQGSLTQQEVPGLSVLRDAARVLDAFEALPAPVQRAVVAGVERSRRSGPGSHRGR